MQVTDPNLMVGKKKILSVREEQGAFRLPVPTFHGGAFAAVLAEITSMKLLEHEARYVATGICNTVDVLICGDWDLSFTVGHLWHDFFFWGNLKFGEFFACFFWCAFFFDFGSLESLFFWCGELWVGDNCLRVPCHHDLEFFVRKGNGGWILKALGFKAAEMAWDVWMKWFGMFGMVVTGPVN